jgi:hypothetical protein
MDTRFKTTFIPKQQVSPVGAQKRKQRGVGAGAIGIAASVVFVLALLLTAGAFLYERILTRRVATLEAELADAHDAFEPEVIEVLKRADARMRAAASLLAAHTAETPIFTLLEEETIRSVRYTGFKYTRAGGPGGKLELRGEARSFRSIALEADALGAHPEILSPVFSDLDQGAERDLATFEFESQIGRKLTDYGALVAEEAGASSAP